MPHFADLVYQFGGAPVGAGMPLGGKSKFFFIDIATNGASDGNDGLSPDHAVLSFYMALAKCVSGRRDTIYVLNYASANETEWPISVNKAGVSIFGARGGGYMPRYTGGQIIQPTSDAAGMTLDANNIRVDGLEFRAGASYSGIMFDTAGVSRHGIYNCVFTSGAYGVWATANSMPSQGPHIKNCTFLANLTSDGILYVSNGAFARFEDNIFDECGGIAINITGAAHAGFVLNNVISMKAATAAKGIVITGSEAQRWIIDGNHANFGATTMTNNPYWDSSGQDNHWLLNYRDIVAVLPAES